MQTCNSVIQNCCRMQGRYVVGRSHITTYLGEGNPLHSIHVPLSWWHLFRGEKKMKEVCQLMRRGSHQGVLWSRVPCYWKNKYLKINIFSPCAKPNQLSFESFVPWPSMTSLEAWPRFYSVKMTTLDTCRNGGILSIKIVFAEIIGKTSQLH